jgi:3-carboxy-cis,cis-muconate cycloisomerase
MPYSPADSSIFSPLFGDPAVSAIFSDEHLVQKMLEVEGAIARVEGRLAVIPPEAGQQIASATRGLKIDFERLRAGTETDGFPVIELVKQIRAQARVETAGYVHWGATTQDILDTALVLQVREGLGVLENNLHRLTRGLAGLADRHRNTLMAGRTHSQQALPITFGFKVANWLAPLLRDRQRLAELKPRLLVLQFGGAVGTLAALGEAGPRVQAGLADELGLGVPLMPWHTQRDALAELAGWLALLSGGLAKMAQDVILLAQTEIAEVRETTDKNRGGSSTMPQKGNPIVSETIVAAARMNASLLAAMHTALLPEHERAAGSWQVEWLALPQMFGLTAGALERTVFVCDNLDVDQAQMEQNVRASQGLMLAEALSFELAQSMGRVEAEKLVRSAAREAVEQDRHLVDVVREKIGGAANWPTIHSEADYLGATQAFIDRVLAEATKE